MEAIKGKTVSKVLSPQKIRHDIYGALAVLETVFESVLDRSADTTEAKDLHEFALKKIRELVKQVTVEETV